MSYTQENRVIAIDTPLGKDVLLLQGFTGREGISRLFSFDVDLLSETPSIAFADIIGKNVTISAKMGVGTERYFNGVVSRFAQSGSDERFTYYNAEIVPWLWFLTRTADCRIFQNMTIPDIIVKIFSDLGFSDFKKSLQGNYSPREYCVQYRETDFNFVSRLMEQYGIFYFFEHAKGKHTLVMADSTNVHKSCPGQAKARYERMTGGLGEDDVVTGWHMEQELRPGKYALTDYNFETPSTNLMVNEPSIVNVGGNTKYEIYDYPGEYLENSQGQNLAKVRMEEEEATHLVVAGDSVCRAFTSGYRFDLEGHDRADFNDSYVLTDVQHSATVGASYTAEGTGTGEHYSNHFSCIPLSCPYRPARITPKPFVQGPQPALVVGKSGEEIWTDKYGRVKVQFYWDRQGKRDENSSCWIRVSHPWAGGGWGSIALPRMGQEVIVDFLEGDPDRPIIMGRVYNAAQMPPYALPGNQTRSTLQSRSSKGGGTANYNEIRLEDKKGDEQIFINAEKDMDHRVENDSREYVGNNRHLVVNASQFELVSTDKHGHVKGKHNEKIESDKSLQVGGNCMESITGKHSVQIASDRKETVAGSDSRTVSGDVKEQVGGAMSLTLSGAQKESIGGDVSRQVGGAIKEQVGGGFSQTVAQSSNVQTGQAFNVTAGQTINLEGGMSINIQAGQGICLTGPGGFVSIGPSGVTIQGIMVLINSGGAPSPATSASPQSPDSPASPDTPDAPTDPTDPDTADDGSKGGKLN